MVDHLIGTILNNRYSVEKFLGKGGMSNVYLAWDQQRSTHLALKFLRQDLVENQVFLERFELEAQTLSKLQHPNIVRFYGIEKDKGHVFILMDYIEGRTLQSVILENKGKPLNQKYIIKVMHSVCTALYFAHQSNLIHCDIKPANIMINKNDDVLLADFGITRMKDADSAKMAGIGTPAYMAPELILRQSTSPQSDIYSLGIVLYEMVTGGTRPFTGKNSNTSGTLSEKLRWEQVHIPPYTPRLYNPNLSSEMETVIMRCLAKKPADRFDGALDLLNSLELSAWVEEEQQNDEEPLEEEAKTISRKPHLKLPNWKIIAAGIFMILIILIGFLIIRSDGKEDDFSQSMAKTSISAIEPILVHIPEGNFLMGTDDPGADDDEKPEHEVFLDDYWIYKTEVTNSEFRQCITALACSGSLSRYKDDDIPAVFVSWDQANEFCEWAGGRLPTEAEWEKAARGTDGQKYPWGETAPSCDLANYKDCTGAVEPVGSYPAGASPYGILDMAGNVWEWTADWADEGGNKILRGGAWSFKADGLITYSRYWIQPATSSSEIGFRCVHDSSP